MDIEEMRKEFESDNAFCGMDFARAENYPEYYASPYANGAWDGWQASRKAVVIDLPRVRDFYGPSSECEEGYETWAIEEAITAAGVRYK